MKHLTTAIPVLSAATIVLVSGLSGCAAFSCDNYMTYDDTLNSWIGAELSDYERRTDNRAYSTMDRPPVRRPGEGKKGSLFCCGYTAFF